MLQLIFDCLLQVSNVLHTGQTYNIKFFSIVIQVMNYGGKSKKNAKFILHSIVYTQVENYSKTCVKHYFIYYSKIDKTKILMTNGSLMKVERIAECSPWTGIKQ